MPVRYIGRMIVVVGAGIIGTSIARRLALAGRRVRLIDAHEAGRGATHAAAGMLAPGGEFETDSVWLRLAMRSLALYPAWIRELSEETGLEIDYRVCGAVQYGEDLAERCQRQRPLGIACEMRGDTAFYPGDGVVDPRDVFRALIASCRRLGVEVVEGQPVERIDDSDGPVVIAAGAWSGSIPAFSGGRRVALPRTTPMKGHLIGYSLEPGLLPHIVRSGHTYIVQRASGFTIAGSTSEDRGFDASVDPAVCARLRERAERLWPELRGHELVDAWTGFRPLCETGEPAIGRVEGTQIWTAYGHYRNGILLAPVTEDAVSEGILAACDRGC